MDSITWEDALRELDLLDLPSVVRIAFADPTRIPAVLKWDMRDPGEIFEEPADPGHHPPGAITPLWADHTGQIVVGHRRSGGVPGYLRFLLEEGELIEEGLTFHQLIVWELVAIWERAKDEAQARAAVREAAEHLAFPASDRFVEALRAGTERGTKHEELLAALRAMLA